MKLRYALLNAGAHATLPTLEETVFFCFPGQSSLSSIIATTPDV